MYASVSGPSLPSLPTRASLRAAPKTPVSHQEVPHWEELPAGSRQLVITEIPNEEGGVTILTHRIGLESKYDAVELIALALETEGVLPD